VPLPEKVEAQVRKTFANLDAILKPAGLARKDLVFVRIHLVDFERLIEHVNKTYLECVGEGPLPGRTVVGVSQLTRGALVEMDFVVRTA
jgi:enamine deaminase RidA (YjgF/YER057c/UK114 family)